MLHRRLTRRKRAGHVTIFNASLNGTSENPVNEIIDEGLRGFEVGEALKRYGDESRTPQKSRGRAGLRQHSRYHLFQRQVPSGRGICVPDRWLCCRLRPSSGHLAISSRGGTATQQRFQAYTHCVSAASTAVLRTQF